MFSWEKDIFSDADKLRLLADWVDSKYPNDPNPEVQTDLRQIASRLVQLELELKLRDRWVQDLQSGMFVNCVYCGHRFGPKDKVPVSMADALKQHMERCPNHPMSKLKKRYECLEQAFKGLMDYICL